MPNMAKSAESRLTNVSFGHQIAIVGSLQFVRKLCVIPWHSWHSTFVWIEQFPMPPCATATDSRFSNTQANIKQWNNHFSIFVALARTFAFNFFQSLLLISFDLTWLVLFDYKLYDWIVRCLEIYEWFGNDIRINARSKRMTALVSCTTSFVSFSVYNMDKRCWEIDWRDWFHGNSESIAATATAAGAILRWWRDLCFFLFTVRMIDLQFNGKLPFLFCMRWAGDFVRNRRRRWLRCSIANEFTKNRTKFRFYNV